MKIGDIIRAIDPPNINKDTQGYVLKGALALVVDGPKEFPEEFKNLCDAIDFEFHNFIFIKWFREDPRWKGRIDGAYGAFRFQKAMGEILN